MTGDESAEWTCLVCAKRFGEMSELAEHKLSEHASNGGMGYE